MSDLDELTKNLSRVLDEYCDHCGLNALAVHLTTAVMNSSESRQGACDLADEIAERMKQAITMAWDDCEASHDEAGENSETRH